MMRLLDIAEEDQTLRPYQTQSKVEIYKAWETSPSVMFQMPTGTGKTRLFVSIIKDTQKLAQNDKQRYGVLVLAHRTELIEQIDGTLSSDKYRIAHGIIKSGYETEMRYPVQVASVQTLIRRLDEWKEKSFSYIIIDEAHHAIAKTYRKVCNAFAGAKILGVTATPYRLSGASFRDLFGKLIVSQSVGSFIKQGYLSKYDYYSILPNSVMQKVIDGITSFGSDGDYAEAALMEACDKDYIRAGLVESYQKYAYGKKGIIYTINHAHNEHVSAAFSELGLNVVTIDSDTPSETRKDLVKKFRKGQIDIICNVNIFSEGFDCPDIEFIQLARPTRSLSMYLQQVGRGLRPCSGKRGAIIIDNVGLYNRFGLPSANRQWRHHFEGKNNDAEEAKTVQKSFGKKRDYNFEEGDESLQLVYSFDGPDLNEQDQEANWLSIIEAYHSAEVFPVGIKGESDYEEYLSTINVIKKDPKLSRSEKDAKILSAKFLIDGFDLFGMSHYETVEEYVESVEEHLASKWDIDEGRLNEIEDKLYREVRFKYNEKYGLAVKKNIHDVSALFGVVEPRLEEFFEILMEPVYDDIQIPDQADHMVCVKDGKAGLINGYDKTEILPFKYDEIVTVGRNLFIAGRRGKKGLIKNGQQASDFIYDAIVFPPGPLGFSFNLALVVLDTHVGILDYSTESSTVRWAMDGIVCISQKHGYYAADAGHGLCCLCDRNGEIVFPALAFSIKVTDNKEIPIVLDVGSDFYLSKKLLPIGVNDSTNQSLKGDFSIVSEFVPTKNKKHSANKARIAEKMGSLYSGNGSSETINASFGSEKSLASGLVAEFFVGSIQCQAIKSRGIVKLYLGGSEVKGFVYSDVEYLYNTLFKFRQPKTDWGIARINERGEIKVLKQPVYDRITVKSKLDGLVELERSGYKPNTVIVF